MDLTSPSLTGIAPRTSVPEILTSRLKEKTFRSGRPKTQDKNRHGTAKVVSETAQKFQRIAPDVKLGKNVRIYDFTNLYGCEIGDDVKIGTFVEIQKGSKIGNRCKVSSHTFICEGVTLEDDVFIGHNVTFINDRYPRATNGDGKLQTESD